MAKTHIVKHKKLLKGLRQLQHNLSFNKKTAQALLEARVAGTAASMAKGPQKRPSQRLDPHGRSQGDEHVQARSAVSSEATGKMATMVATHLLRRRRWRN